jgi:hypothetical protein
MARSARRVLVFLLLATFGARALGPRAPIHSPAAAGQHRDQADPLEGIPELCEPEDADEWEDERGTPAVLPWGVVVPGPSILSGAPVRTPGDSRGSACARLRMLCRARC